MAMSPGSKRGDAESKMRCRAVPSVFVAFLKWKIQSVVSVFFHLFDFFEEICKLLCVCGVYGFLCRVPFIAIYHYYIYDFRRWFWCDCLFLFFGCIFKIHMTLNKSESCHLRIWIFQEVTFRPYDFFNVFFPLFARHDFIDLQPKKNIESSVHMKAMVGQIGGMNLATETVEFYTPWISVISRNVMEFKHAACRSCKGWFDDRPILMWKNRCQWVHIRLFEFGFFYYFLSTMTRIFSLTIVTGVFQQDKNIHLFLVFQNHSFCNNLHPRKLTWNLKMMVGKMIFLLNWMVFRFHVNLPGCILANFQKPHVLWFRGSTREAPVGGLGRIVSSKVLMCSLFDLLFEVLGATLALNLEVKNDQCKQRLIYKWNYKFLHFFFEK